MFTDVEASTPQWESFPEAMKVALEQHYAVLRNKLIDFEGYEVKTVGDAMMAAFQSPKAAAQWCMSVQQALLEVQWPKDIMESPFARLEKSKDESTVICAGLRVRIGAHYGVAHMQYDKTTGRADYFGL